MDAERTKSECKLRASVYGGEGCKHGAEQKLDTRGGLNRGATPITTGGPTTKANGSARDLSMKAYRKKLVDLVR